ncbi:MAG: YggT family protein [Candidatus Saccharibacteria bacterium]
MVDSTERVTEQEQNADGQRVVTRAVSHESRDEHINRGVRIVWFLVGIVVTLLLVRFILALLGANLENAFASFIYSLSDPFVYGFRGLLQVGQFQAGVSRLELETLIAALVYSLVGWGIVSAIRLLSKKA